MLPMGEDETKMKIREDWNRRRWVVENNCESAKTKRNETKMKKETRGRNEEKTKRATLISIHILFFSIKDLGKSRYENPDIEEHQKTFRLLDTVYLKLVRFSSSEDVTKALEAICQNSTVGRF
ncbi:hypothetical protein B9Z55_003945 [Caenorhabditis nigoni]|nr:hypothetical protein B9Z55_003945 [Caenorhabditis nigoni]